MGFTLKKLPRGEIEGYFPFLKEKAPTFFHNPEWIRVIQKSFPAIKPLFLLIEDNGKIGIFPFFKRKYGFFRGIYSGIFGTYGGPILENGLTLGGNFWNQAFVLLPNRKIQIEIHDFSSILSDTDKLKKYNREYSIIDLSLGYEKIYKNYKKSLREQIRQSIRKEVEIRRVENEEDVKIFYQIMKKAYREKHSRETLGLDFFLNIFRYFNSHDKLLWSLAYFKGKPVSGLLDLIHRKFVLAFLHGTLKEFYRTRASSLLFDTHIRHLVQKGCRFYSFGSSPEGKESLLFFKKSFGAKESSYPVFYYENQVLYSSFKWVKKLRRFFYPRF